MIHNLSCKVLSNKRIKQSPYYIVSIISREISKEAKPGQFVMLGGVSKRPGVFLRRPYSVCGANGTFDKIHRDSFQILYKIVGKGTRALSETKAGEKVDILGPLGNPFETKSTRKSKVEHVIIAGGVGSAPFPLLVHQLNQSKIKPTMLYGGKSHEDLPLRAWFKKHCGDFRICTEDGSMGQRGLVSCLFQDFEAQQRSVRVYACGPHRMLQAVTDFAEKRGYKAYGSFEERMACGFGVCLGCAIPVRGKDGKEIFKHVCRDGPIFNMKEVIYT